MHCGMLSRTSGPGRETPLQVMITRNVSRGPSTPAGTAVLEETKFQAYIAAVLEITILFFGFWGLALGT